MIRTIFVSLFLTILINAFGQGKTDTIEIKKNFGTAFYQNGKRLSLNKLSKILQSDIEASKEMAMAKKNYRIGSVISFGGGALIGWGLATALSGDDENWVLVGVGAGLVAVSYPFSSSCTKHAKKAVSIFNSNIKQTSLNRFELNIGFSYNRIGMRLTF